MPGEAILAAWTKETDAEAIRSFARRAMPNSVILGRLRMIDGQSIILGGDLRLFLAPGVPMPAWPLGTSLTITAVSHEGVLYAENIRPTFEDDSLGGGIGIAALGDYDSGL